ncbi:MAG TPA: LytTR family DNA-binding domain-containing protein [Allosphingosinicella sp.]|uniref:LytR/AlgR family response regulator transcription factor n=1 Tax=Allosphingosinicella sp. TaxID=2823234 RepID=UPI002ED9FFFA
MQRRLRIMIVEDEPLATRRLLRLIKEEPDFEVAGVAENGRQALEAIGAVRPDILLLDIEMPGINGFDLLGHLPDNVSPAVIFVTAFDAYAVKAFEARAVDFVMKPVVAERLHAALAQARRDISTRDAERKLAELQQVVATLRRTETDDSDGYEKEIWAQQRSEMVRIPAGEIDWIEAEKDYVRIHTGGRSYLLHGMIGALAERLDPKHFMRVHRSAIVRLDRVRAVRRGPYAALDLQLECGRAVRVGRKYGSEVRSRLG